MRTIGQQLRAMRLGSYGQYLAGRHWRSFRNHLQAGRPNCMACQKYKGRELHHVNYGRLGRESKSDVIALCCNCHDAIHKALDSRYPGSSLEVLVTHTKDVIEEATGAAWREVRARWEWYLKGMFPVVRKNGKKLPRKAGRRNSKRKKQSKAGRKLQRAINSLKRKSPVEYATFVCGSCEWVVTRPKASGYDIPCRCGNPVRLQRAEATAPNSLLLESPASVSMTTHLSPTVGGELDSPTDSELSQSVACNHPES